MASIDSNLLTAIIAATAALFGAAVGQLGPLVQHWLSGRRERRDLLRRNYEHFASLIGEMSATLRRVRFSDPVVAPVDAGHLGEVGMKAKTLALLYFPEFIDATERLVLAGAKFENELRSSNDDDDQSIDVTRRKYQEAHTSVSQLIRDQATKYT